MKRLVSIFLMVVMMMTAATVLAEESEAKYSDEILTVAIMSEPNSTVPDVAFLSNYISTINRLIYEPLITADYETLELYDTGLCTGWERIDDLSFRLTLHEGVTFHNGEELTTADVLYQFQQGAQGAQTDHYGLFDVDSFVVEDDYNIIIVTTEPWAQAIELMSFNTMMAVSKTVLEAADGADTTQQYLENAGTGKYKFAEWVPGEYILLERNEEYWDQDNLGYFAGFKFVFITDSTARALAVQSGDADIAIDADIANYALYNADSTIKANLMGTGSVNTLFLNSGNGGPLEDVLVREAIYWLIDKVAIRQVANSGLGSFCDTTIATNGPMRDGIVEIDKVVDVDRAKQLLTEAGYPDGLTLTLRVSGSSTVSASLIQEQLRQGGITVDIVIAETPVHFQALASGDYDMYTSSQQYAYYSEAVRTCNGDKFSFRDVYGGCGYKNEEFAEICLKCYSTMDVEARKAAYAEFQAHFRENFVSIGLYTNVGLVICRPDLENMKLFGVGVVNLADMYSTDAQ